MTATKQGEVLDGGLLEKLGNAPVPSEHIGQPSPARHTQQPMALPVAQIGIDEQDRGAVARQADGQVDGRDRLPFLGLRAGDENGSWWSLGEGKKKRGTNSAV